MRDWPMNKTIKLQQTDPSPRPILTPYETKQRIEALEASLAALLVGAQPILGTVTPEGNQSASPRTLYFKTTSPKSLWIKETGTGNTGWTNLLEFP